MYNKGKSVVFFTPVMCFLIACVLLKIIPFGNNTLLIQDMNGQYIDYFAYLKDLYAQNNNLLYSFSKSMGGDLVGFSAYYLLSPLNVIFLVFPKTQFPMCVTILIAIKLGLCGLTCSLFLQEYADKGRNIYIFSTSYALISYNIIYCSNVMWLDGVYMLPVIALGIEHILKKSRIELYVLALAYSLIVNYYIGYMLCIFTVLYYLYRVVSMKIEGIPVKRSFLNYVSASILAGGISAIILIPTFLSLKGTKASIDIGKFAFKLNYPLKNIFLKLFTGTISRSEMINGLPNIFCGILIVVLIVLYFLNNEINFKSKIISAVILFVLMASFVINPINLIWHGFNPPSWFPYRNSFVFSFILICISVQCWEKIFTGNTKKHFFYAAFIILGTVFLLPTEEAEFLSSKSVLFDCALACFMLFVLYIIWRERNPKNIRRMVFLLTLLQLGSLTVNATSVKWLGLGNAKNYSDYVGEVSESIEWIKRYDSSFYRMEKIFSRTKNDPMQFSYNGLSHFSSTEKTKVKNFLGKLGFRNNGNWVYYNRGATVAADAFLGVKYLVSRGEIDKPYKLLESGESINIYENPFSLPIGFCVSEQVLNAHLDETNLFERQNELFSALLGRQVQIFTAANVLSIQEENVIASEKNNFISYKKLNSQDTAYIHYQVEIKSSDTLYMYISAPSTQVAELFVNGVSLGKYFDTYQWDIVSLGQYAPGEIIDVCLQLGGENLSIGTAWFYFESLPMLEECYDDLMSGNEQAVIEKISSSYLAWSGVLSDDSSTLLFTIPAEDGWTAKIDGETVPICSAFDTLLALEVESGFHEVELRYIPSGLYLGAAVSGGSLFLFLLILQRKYFKRRDDNVP